MSITKHITLFKVSNFLRAKVFIYTIVFLKYYTKTDNSWHSLALIAMKQTVAHDLHK